MSVEGPKDTIYTVIYSVINPKTIAWKIIVTEHKPTQKSKKLLQLDLYVLKAAVLVKKNDTTNWKVVFNYLDKRHA